MAREFRTPESYIAERMTRDMLEPFLKARGFRVDKDERKPAGKSESQVIRATNSRGEQIAMWVRLCWRRDRRNAREKKFSAAQLQARIKGTDWVASLEKRMAAAAAKGVTHLLLVQRDETRIIYAACIPLAAVIPIWERQRDESSRLIKSGRLGRRKKNHAQNGVSPTLWLQDDSAPEVAATLWNYSGVVDLARTEASPLASLEIPAYLDDSYDDLPVTEIQLPGRDGPGEVKIRLVSKVARDPKVRAKVVDRSGGRCENSECGEFRDYVGFLDVHHILGVFKSDRPWNCVALCPNCHRHAHYSPDAEEFNARLYAYALRFKPDHVSEDGDYVQATVAG
jgi:5-methylcytosine-specific restriction enzyme A